VPITGALRLINADSSNKLVKEKNSSFFIDKIYRGIAQQKSRGLAARGFFVV
jgi:hypothetical protein